MSTANIMSTTPPAYGTLTVSQDSSDHTNEESTSPKDHRTKCQKILGILRSNLLVILLIIALVLGIGLGACLRLIDTPLNDREKMYLRFPGEILMNMLQLLILPLIVSSLISGLTSLDTRSSGKLGARAIVYYLTTTLLAVILGIILVISIRPGDRGSPRSGETVTKNIDPADTFLDLIRQMFPANIVEACFSKRLTELTLVKISEEERNASLAQNATIVPKYKPVLKKTDGINMLGLVVFSIATGIAINVITPKGKPLKDFIDALCETTLTLVSAVIWYSPIGVLFLVAHQVVDMEDPVDAFEQLSFYFLTVMAGLAGHGFIVLPLIYFLIVRKNPYRFLVGVLQAMLTALGTSSSSATLPVTMRNLEENNGVDPRVTAFVAPVGATINMDGTALYEAVAVIFIGQVNGFEMDLGNVITICLTSTAAAIGAAGVPQAGLVTMVIVLTAVGFPTDDIGMILAIDWLLDRFRTMVNVLGDAFGAGIVDHLSKDDLRKMDEEDLSLERARSAEEMDKKHHKNVGGIENSAFDNSRM